jgi:hypothetical protein
LFFVPQVHAHQLRAEIEIALARAIGEPAAFGIGNMQRLPAFLKAPCAVVGLPRDEVISSDVSVFDAEILLMIMFSGKNRIVCQVPG